MLGKNRESYSNKIVAELLSCKIINVHLYALPNIKIFLHQPEYYWVESNLFPFILTY